MPLNEHKGHMINCWFHFPVLFYYIPQEIQTNTRSFDGHDRANKYFNTVNFPDAVLKVLYIWHLVAKAYAPEK